MSISTAQEHCPIELCLEKGKKGKDFVSTEVIGLPEIYVPLVLFLVLWLLPTNHYVT